MKIYGAKNFISERVAEIDQTSFCETLMNSASLATILPRFIQAAGDPFVVGDEKRVSGKEMYLRLGMPKSCDEIENHFAESNQGDEFFFCFCFWCCFVSVL